MKYRIIDFTLGYASGSDVPVVASLVQMKLLFFWVTIRKYICIGDNGYARFCAKELLDKLTEEI